MQPAFVHKALDGLASLLEGIVHELLDDVERQGRADLVSQFTARYPVQVSADMLGIPRADHPRYQRWALDLMGFTLDFERAATAAAEIRNFLLPIIAQRRVPVLPGDTVESLEARVLAAEHALLPETIALLLQS